MPEPIQQATEKVVFEFQHTDEQGKPILDPRTGKPAFTNLTGATEKEVLDKLKDSYLNVTRAYARSRNHQAVPKEPELQRKELSVEEERQAAVDLQDPTKARAAVRKLTGADDIEARQEAADKAKFTSDAKAAAYQFMSQHLNDYYPCTANSDILSRFMNENKPPLDPRFVDNYEIALNAVGHLLAPRPVPAAPPPNDPPPPVRQSNGGIIPGESTGSRPTRKPKNEVTKDSINEMRRTAEGRAEYKKRMRDPEFVRQVNAAMQT